MVKIKTIEKIINKIIWNKIQTKHAPHISWTKLEEKINNDEDYEIISDAIDYFHKEKVNRKKNKTESLVGWYDEDTKYENWDGEEDNVKIPKKMRIKGLTDSLFFMCHSHVKYKSCFQSDDDFESILKYNVKYSFTMAKDGFMLIINNNKHSLNADDYNNHVGKMEKAQERTKIFNDTMKTYNAFSKAMDKEFYKEYVPKLNDEKLNKLIRDYNSGNIDVDVYLKKISKPYHEFYTSTLPDSADELNNLMKQHNIEVHYFPKTE